MTNIERKALELVNEVSEVENCWFSRDVGPLHEAFCRAIEKHEAFKREVSDALSVYQKADGVEERSRIWDALTRFIITKPDPLVEIIKRNYAGSVSPSQLAYAVRKELDERGLEIREKE